MEEANVGDNLNSTVRWTLTDEGMGLLERAGLAAIYLSLSAVEQWAAQGDSEAIAIFTTGHFLPTRLIWWT